LEEYLSQGLLWKPCQSRTVAALHSAMAFFARHAEVTPLHSQETGDVRRFLVLWLHADDKHHQIQQRHGSLQPLNTHSGTAQLH